MAWLLSLVIVFEVHAQRSEVWSNLGLSARGVADGQKRKAAGVQLFRLCMIF